MGAVFLCRYSFPGLTRIILSMCFPFLLHDLSSCLLTILSGESAWIPFGCSAVFMGIPMAMLGPKPKGKGPKAARQDEFVSFLCTLACDSKDCTRSKETCGAVSGDILKSSAAIPSSIKQDEGFKVWRASVECAADPSAKKAADPPSAIAPAADGGS